MTTLLASDLSKGLFDSPVDFRSEVIYFLIVDRFYDATSDEEERQGVWDEQGGLCKDQPMGKILGRQSSRCN